MSYIVVYQDATGSPGLEFCDDIDTAVMAAERMRNVEGIEMPRIYKAEEIHFDFRPYYRVEVADETVAPMPVAVESPAPPPAPMVDETDTTAADAEPESAPGWSEVQPAADSIDDVVLTADDVAEAVDDVDEIETPEPVISARRGLFGR
ncbi:MAG: hypothetical protein ACR2P0_03885 [Acidimicrobiales bacterium]